MSAGRDLQHRLCRPESNLHFFKQRTRAPMMFQDHQSQTSGERPVNPEPAEYLKIKSAFRVARITGGWCGWLLSRAALAIPVIIGVVSTWYLGLASFVVCYGA